MKNDHDSPNASELMREATQRRTTLLGEFGDLMRENKKWWLAPIVISVLLLGALVLLGGTGAAPFIYTLF